jgi:hypothetical protein
MTTELILQQIAEKGVLFIVLGFGFIHMYKHFMKLVAEKDAIIKAKDDQLRSDTKELIKAMNDLTNSINMLINKAVK